jgi:hypothetical protein
LIIAEVSTRYSAIINTQHKLGIYNRGGFEALPGGRGRFFCNSWLSRSLLECLISLLHTYNATLVNRLKKLYRFYVDFRDGDT